MTLTIQGTAIKHCRDYGLKDYASNNPPATSIPTQRRYYDLATANMYGGSGIQETSFLASYRVPNSPAQVQHNKLITICTLAYFIAYNPTWKEPLNNG